MIVVEEFSAEIIKIILSMTFTGSIISLLLFILKPIIKDKLPKAFQYYMWFSVVAALMLPVSKIIVIPISDYSMKPIKSVYDIAQGISDTVSEKSLNYVSASQYGDVQNISQTTYFPSAAVFLYVLWQSGMLLVLGFHVICYVSYIRRINKHNISADQQETALLNSLSGKNSLRIYKNTLVNTPILIGFLHPAIILPNKKYEDTKLRNIFMHEIVHMKRHDIFIKWLLIFVGAIHWFNPFVYLARREMNKACELACDETVIKKFGIREMQLYGDTLISVAADSIRKMPLSITMFEDKKNLKERLDAIMKHKKFSKRTVITASAILITIVCAILGSSTLYGAESNHNYADNFPLPEDQKRMKESELKKALCDYDEKNIVKASVYLNELDGETANAYIHIVYQEKNPDSQMQNELKSLVSEKLGLDTQNIYVDYIDLVSFTSDDTENEYSHAKRMKESELKKTLCDYDKQNIVAATVFLSDLDGEITNAYINIVCKEKNPDLEMQNEIKSLVSEELGLSTQNIYVDYIDLDSYTSDGMARN